MVSPAAAALLNAKAAPSREGARLEEVCQEVESLFVYYLLQKMRDSFPKMGYLHGGYEEEIYNTLMDQQVAVSITRQGGMGLSRLLYEELQGEGRLPQPRSGAAAAAYRKCQAERLNPRANEPDKYKESQWRH